MKELLTTTVSPADTPLSVRFHQTCDGDLLYEILDAAGVVVSEFRLLLESHQATLMLPGQADLDLLTPRPVVQLGSAAVCAQARTSNEAVQAIRGLVPDFHPEHLTFNAQGVTYTGENQYGWFVHREHPEDAWLVLRSQRGEAYATRYESRRWLHQRRGTLLPLDYAAIEQPTRPERQGVARRPLTPQLRVRQQVYASGRPEQGELHIGHQQLTFHLEEEVFTLPWEALR